MVERIRQQGDRRVALITLTQSGQKLGKTIPDPIEKKFVNQLADLEPENLQIMAMAMDQILNLIDTERSGGNSPEMKVFSQQSYVGEVSTRKQLEMIANHFNKRRAAMPKLEHASSIIVRGKDISP